MIDLARIRALLATSPEGVAPQVLAGALGADVRTVLAALERMDDVQRCAPPAGFQCWAWRLSFSLAPKLRRHVQAQIDSVRQEKTAATRIRAGTLLTSDDGVTVRPFTPAMSGDSVVAGTAAPAAVEPTAVPMVAAAPAPAAGERSCRYCGCTDADCSRCIALTGEPCSWVAVDVCSACVPPALRAILTVLADYPGGCSVGRIVDVCRLRPSQVHDLAAAYPSRLSIGVQWDLPWIRAAQPPAPSSGA